MITCLAIGDPHFKVGNVRETNEMVEKILILARERRPTFIVVLGDILDRHEMIHVSPLERSTKFLKSLSEIAPLYVLIGNHDRPNNSNFLTTEHPFNALKYWPNTHIVDVGLVDTIQDKKFVFVPYVPVGRFMEAVQKILDPTSKYAYPKDMLGGVTALFAHQEFRGAKMGAIISEVGDEWSVDYPPVFSGHIHDYDELQKNIIYMGTPIQHGFGDREDKTISWITYKEDSFIHERIDLNLTKKIIVHLNTTEVRSYTPPPNRQVKIIINGTSAEIKAVMKLHQIKTLTQSGVKVVYKDVPTETKYMDRDLSQLSFSARLYRAVQGNKELKELYEHIFRKVPVPTSQVLVQQPLKLKIVP